MAADKSGTYAHQSLTVKVVLLGDLGVGKTTFLQTLMAGKFTRSNSLSNSLECQQKYFPHGNKEILLKLFDTAGQEKYRSLTASYYRGMHACIIFFDVTNAESFDNVYRWLDDLKCYVVPAEVVIVLVGMKCHALNREVSRDRATQFANSKGVPYLEVSAEEDIASVNSVCDMVTHLVLERTDRLTPPSEINKKLTRQSKWGSFCCAC